MSKIKQQLVDVGHKIKVLQEDLSLSTQQYETIQDMAQDAHMRALVSETPADTSSDQEMQLTKTNLEKVILEIQQEILELKIKQDELLEKLYEESS